MGGFSIEFEEDGQFHYMSVRFWKESTLCKVKLSRFSKTIAAPLGYFTTLSRLLSTVSSRPDLVGCSGCPLDVFETLDHCKIFSKGILHPFRFDALNLSRLMHRQSFSVFGRLDFFAVFENLIISLGGALSSPWILETPELAKVTMSFVNFVLSLYGLSRFCSF